MMNNALSETDKNVNFTRQFYLPSMNIPDRFYNIRSIYIFVAYISD